MSVRRVLRPASWPLVGGDAQQRLNAAAYGIRVGRLPANALRGGGWLQRSLQPSLPPSAAAWRAPRFQLEASPARQSSDHHMHATAALPRRAATSRPTSATPTALLAAAAGPSTSRQSSLSMSDVAAAAPEAAVERPAAASRPAAATSAATPSRGNRCRNLLLAAAVAAVWALLTAAHLTDRPLLLVRPPITRWGEGCTRRFGFRSSQTPVPTDGCQANKPCRQHSHLPAPLSAGAAPDSSSSPRLAAAMHWRWAHGRMGTPLCGEWAARCAAAGALSSSHPGTC